MLITKTQDYAIRIMRMLYMTEKAQAKEIAEAENIPPTFVSTIIPHLSHAGLVKSTKGRSVGGHMLARPASDITLYDVLSALDPDFCISHCTRSDYSCSMNRGTNICYVHNEICRVQGLLVQELQKKSLEELFRGEGQDANRP